MSKLSPFKIALLTLAVLSILALSGALWIEGQGRSTPSWLVGLIGSFASAIVGMLVPRDRGDDGRDSNNALGGSR